MKKNWLLVLFIPVMIITGGCWDRTELNQTNLAIAVGLDDLPGDRLRFTVQIPVSQKTPGQTPPSPPFVVVSTTGETFTTAGRNIMLKNPRSILWQHWSANVWGESLARRGLAGLVDEFARNRNVRKTGDVFIARDTTAAEVLSVPTEVERIPGVALTSMIKSEDLYAGIYTRCLLRDFIIRSIKPGIEPAVPGISVVKDPSDRCFLQISGTALFMKGKLVGWMNEEESRGYRWLQPKTVLGGIMTVRCPYCGSPVVLQSLRSQCRITPALQGQEIIMRVKIKQEGFFYEQTCTHPLVTPAMLKTLERESAQLIRQQVLDSVKKAQELGSDVFGFGLALKQHYPQTWDRVGSSWEEVFPAVRVEVDVESKIRRTHLTRRTAVIRY
ncbi:MAG: Ger(x)C family spore germination protein [Syntrophothermus sp.]|uniref:Ger(x)C family spore germination protein n=1 Tax=Syntrophothermus sp. TaxID=2736299 RepID=UPI00257E6543|nr:Ger(x)C family spore germination protein [Syntrophothermus sp.]NSW81736.1 Ger(x)C family spore germination protein [Syntrophothermus sp.]